MTVCLHRALQHKTMKPRVGLCEGFCAYPAGRMASVYLRGTETQCWGLCAPLSQKAILPLKYQEQRRRNCGKAGQFTQPSRNAFAAQSADFPGHSRSAKCQGKGNAEGSILKQDKGRGSQVAPARITTPRSAGRFKGFQALKRGCIRGSHSTRWDHHWGLILLKCPRLAAFSGDRYGDEG